VSDATGADRRPSMLLLVGASSAGTAFEWYDFFLFGTLASVLASTFTGGSSSMGFLFTLAAFAIGFFVRPFGAIVFGHIGDRHGRKRAFVQTIVLMGASTTAIGLIPSFEVAGIVSPILLVLIRIVQGFAIGGEYGGAAIYVAEHAERSRRGLMTSWIQSTAALGLLMALGVVLATRWILGEERFLAWGWRLPFLLSAGLLAVSLWIRLKLSETPEFERMRKEMLLSKSPLSEALRGANLKRVIVALCCILLAQGAVWYTGHFYIQFFLERVLKVDGPLVNMLLITAVVTSAGAYVFFGWLSDRVGRKPVLMFGMLLAIISYFPGFKYLTANANPALEAAARSAPVVLLADQSACSLQFDLLGRRQPESACDVFRAALTDAGVPFSMQHESGSAIARVSVGQDFVLEGELFSNDAAAISQQAAELTQELQNVLLQAGYPAAAERDSLSAGKVLGIIILFMISAAALYGPQAAALVELFPSSVRYTALSLPYNLGTGWVGGLLPVSAFALVAATGDIYAGLYYPMVFTLISFVCTWLFLPETRGISLTQSGVVREEVGVDERIVQRESNEYV